MIPAVRGMVSQDPINHLNCRKTQLLALAANGNPQVDLLMHSALERTFDIYRHCYLAEDYRWSYPVRYVTDPDLTLLGYQLLRSDRAEPGDIRQNVLRFLAADQAVLFMAPRGYLPYWREFMRANQTRESEYYDLHSFVVGGLTPDGDGVLLMDNANEAHEFRPYPVTWAQLREGRAADPDRWFVDNVVMSRVGDPDPAPFARMHAAFVAEHEDEFELYEVIAEQLASEREMYPEAYRVPGINALAGGRQSPAVHQVPAADE